MCRIGKELFDFVCFFQGLETAGSKADAWIPKGRVRLEPCSEIIKIILEILPTLSAALIRSCCETVKSKGDILEAHIT